MRILFWFRREASKLRQVLTYVKWVLSAPKKIQAEFSFRFWVSVWLRSRKLSVAEANEFVRLQVNRVMRERAGAGHRADMNQALARSAEIKELRAALLAEDLMTTVRIAANPEFRAARLAALNKSA